MRDARSPGPGSWGVIGLSLVVLMVMIAVSLRLATDAWERRATEAAEQPPTALPPSRRETLPPVRSLGSPADWITQDDYPIEAMRRHEQGTVALRWSIDRGGRVVGCEVTSSSGWPRLDDAACRAIRRRGRYAPVAPDEPDLRFQARRVVWRLPE